MVMFMVQITDRVMVRIVFMVSSDRSKIQGKNSI